MWIALVGSGDFSHNGIGCVLATMNVSHVINCLYLCWWMLFLCCIVYILCVTLVLTVLIEVAS